MAASKRVRFEVLRRDNYTCRYCRSTENELTVDHVTPVALGGTDMPDNLVAACRDCNAGKASTNPDAPTLPEVTAADVAYEKARAKVIARYQDDADTKRSAHSLVEASWERHVGYPGMAKDWKGSVDIWIARGLSASRICDAIEITGGKYLPAARAYPYMAKICWNWISQLEADIKAELKLAEPAEKPFDPARIVDLFIDRRTDLLPSNVQVQAEVA